MNNYELIEFLFKKTKIKPLEEIRQNRSRYSVRKLNSLNRILQVYIKYTNKINPKYNSVPIIRNSGEHYWLDLWSRNEFITIYFDKI